MKWIRMRALAAIKDSNMRVVVLAADIHGAGMGSFVWVGLEFGSAYPDCGRGKERAKAFLAGSDVYPTTLWERYEAVLY